MQTILMRLGMQSVRPEGAACSLPESVRKTTSQKRLPHEREPAMGTELMGRGGRTLNCQIEYIVSKMNMYPFRMCMILSECAFFPNVYSIRMPVLSISHGILERGFRIPSHFRVNCTLYAFSHAAPVPRSRIGTYFYSFCSLTAFAGHILAAFPHSQHSTVSFWQPLLSLSILARRPCPPSSRTIAFW